jgi:SET domain-containing protein
VLRAIKPIYHDEEILISYGDDYWAKHEQQAQRISCETVEANTAMTVVQTAWYEGHTAKKNTGIKTAKRKKKVITIFDRQ